MYKHVRYHRSDDPKTGLGHTIAAVLVMLVAVAALGALVWFLWQRASFDSLMGESSLRDAAASAKVTPDETVAKVSGDTFDNVVVFAVDDVKAKEPQLQSVNLLVVNTSNPRVTLVKLPADLIISTADAGQTTLAAYYAQKGPASCVGPFVSATYASVQHVVVMGTSQIDELLQIVQSGNSRELASNATTLIGGMRTDMDAQAVVDLVERLKSVSGGAIGNYDPVLTPTDAGQQLDAAAFGIAVGTVQAPA